MATKSKKWEVPFQKLLDVADQLTRDEKLVPMKKLQRDKTSAMASIGNARCLPIIFALKNSRAFP